MGGVDAMNRSAVEEYLPRPGEFDPLAEEAVTNADGNGGARAQSGGKREPLIRWHSPSELAAYEPPPNQNLVGEYHLQRGAPAVLAGPPGCGKSRAALWLAVAGARGRGGWFGLPVHSQFRTLVLQNENGMARLHRDFGGVAGVDDLDDWIRVSSPPTLGLAVANAQFRAELGAVVADFDPQVIVVDPWNACVRDAMERDFSEALSRLREVAAQGTQEPALLILHHLRKPRSEDRHRGRGLSNLLAGSYVLVSVARSVLVMQPASDDTEDSQVVITPAKNNDAALGPRTAWQREGAIEFERVEDFDWEAFDGGGRAEPKVQEEHLREVFRGGRMLTRAIAAKALGEVAHVGRTAAYEALKSEGRLGHLLRESGGLLGLGSAPSAEDLGDGAMDEPL